MASKATNQQASGFTSRRDRPWLLPYNRKLRNLHSISLRNLSLAPSSPNRQRGKTIDDDAVPNTLVSPAKLVALREQRALGHSKSSSDLRRVPENDVSSNAVESDDESLRNTNGSPNKENGVPRTTKRPLLGRMRRRSTLEWANASPQTRQEKLENVTAVRMADVFFSLHIEDVREPVYISETVERTMNPTFRSIELGHNSSGASRLDSVTARFWAKSARWQCWRHLCDVSLALRDLQYLGKSLENLQRPLPHNAVVFHLPDGVYTNFSTLADYVPPPMAPLARANSSRELRTSSFDALLRLSKLDDSIQDALATHRKLSSDLEVLIMSNKDSYVERDRVAEAHDRLKTIEYAKKTVSNQLAKARTQQEEKRASLLSRRELMTKDATRRENQKQTTANEKSTPQQDRDAFEERSKALASQRRRICDDLQKAYPITPIQHKTLAFTIRGLHLPNSEDLDTEPPDVVAAALGHISYTLQLLSFYLDQPLPYPVNPRSSKSTVFDPISLLKTNSSTTQSYPNDKALRTYPLFTSGVPRFRFEYALFLLNKDIQVLLEQCFSVRVLDIRHTLPNLKYLFYVATAGEGELPARKAGGVRGLMRGNGVAGGSRAASTDSANSALSGLLWHSGKPETGNGKGAADSLRRNVGKLEARGKAG